MIAYILAGLVFLLYYLDWKITMILTKKDAEEYNVSEEEVFAVCERGKMASLLGYKRRHLALFIGLGVLLIMISGIFILNKVIIPFLIGVNWMVGSPILHNVYIKGKNICDVHTFIIIQLVGFYVLFFASYLIWFR